MNADFSKSFNKQFERLPLKRQKQAKTAILRFVVDRNTPSLRNHALRGSWNGFYSISAGGDLRLHFKQINANTVLFVAVGTHSQLYS